MKNLIRVSTLLLFVMFFLCSCLMDENEPEVIVDPAYADYKVSWMEIEKRMGIKDWQPINNGDTLTLYLNYINDTTTDVVGTFFYEKIKSLHTNVDNSGDVRLEENEISFYSLSPTAVEDSVNLPIYFIENEKDTLLVIKNDAITPTVEVKYQKVDYEESVSWQPPEDY